jgi:hypothetical protein
VVRVMRDDIEEEEADFWLWLTVVAASGERMGRNPLVPFWEKE